MQLNYKALKLVTVKFLTVTSLITSTFASIGQVKHKPNITDQVRSGIGTYLKLDKGFEYDSCINVICFLKFKIVNGKIDSIAMSKNSPRQVKEGLTTAVSLINKSWHITEAEQISVNTKVFLLPVIFYYEANCTPMIIDKETLSKSKTEKTKDSNSLLKDSLINMLSFDAGPQSWSLECVLIKPVYFANLY